MQESTDKRQYFENFEEAARDFGLRLDNMHRARQVVATLPECDIYIPRKSRSYIAFKEPGGKRMLASIHHGYAWGRSELPADLATIAQHGNGWWAVEFPVNSLRESGGTRSGSAWVMPPPVCDGCSMQLPRTGLCDNCDD